MSAEHDSQAVDTRIVSPGNNPTVIVGATVAILAILFAGTAWWVAGRGPEVPNSDRDIAMTPIPDAGQNMSVRTLSPTNPGKEGVPNVAAPAAGLQVKNPPSDSAAAHANMPKEAAGAASNSPEKS